jgi:hypothetical protein
MDDPKNKGGKNENGQRRELVIAIEAVGFRTLQIKINKHLVQLYSKYPATEMKSCSLET